MRLYSGSSLQFIEDNVRNQIAEKLRGAFFERYRYNPPHSEVTSWRNSLRAFSQVLDHGKLHDHGIVVEYQLPLTSRRLDCMVCGHDNANREQAVIIELKQWERCQSSDTPDTVVTFVGQGEREVLHPSVQVGGYATYLADYHTAFYEPNPVGLSACSYLHNYTPAEEDYLFHPSFHEVLKRWPAFTANDYDSISAFLRDRLHLGRGLEVLARIEQSKLRPSKKLMDHVASVIRGRPEYVLLDEQRIVYNKVMASAKEGIHDKRRRVILVRGGPGTGKSVIALNLVADLSSKGYNTHYTTGSRAFTGTLRKIIGTRGSAQFKFFNSYSGTKPNVVDVLVADEAHRIRETSNSRFTRASQRSSTTQIDELIQASNVGVFFIDDDQIVRPGEVGSSDLIREHARQQNAVLHEYELEAQFRCAGSDAFLSWINNTLGIRRTPHVIWEHRDAFDFQILPGPIELERAIREKVSCGATGRVTAGFCWEWSKARRDGTLVDDVVVGRYKRPWNAQPEARRLAPGIPPATVWAYDPNGLNQIGCVYTAQGFEFDYVGVIFGKDLCYDFDSQAWVGHPEESHDNVVKRSGDRFVSLVKNTYRVLLSRGMKGCYVHFIDKDTERFFRSRME